MIDADDMDDLDDGAEARAADELVHVRRGDKGKNAPRIDPVPITIICSRGYGEVGGAACASMWRVANGKQDGPERYKQSRCKGCPDGEMRSASQKIDPRPIEREAPPVKMPQTVAQREAEEAARNGTARPLKPRTLPLCTHCREPFEPRFAAQRFCNRKCRRAAEAAQPAPPPMPRHGRFEQDAPPVTASAQAKNASADDEFVREHKSFVLSIVKHTRAQLGIEGDAEDVIAFAYEGLIEARERFDASLGVQFKSFAHYRVRGAVIDGLRRSAYLPRRAYARLKATEAVDLTGCGLLEGMKSADQNGVAKLRILDGVLGGIAAAYSTAAGAREQEGISEDPERGVLTRERADQVRRALAVLSDEERHLIGGHYIDDRNFDELAHELGMSKSWASRLHTRALARLYRELSPADPASGIAADRKAPERETAELAEIPTTESVRTTALNAPDRTVAELLAERTASPRVCAREGCTAPVPMPPPGVRGSKPKYCSTSCRDRANYERDKLRAMQTPAGEAAPTGDRLQPVLPDTLTCGECGKPFDRNKLGPPRKTCEKCKPSWQEKAPQPEPRTRAREQCGAPFQPLTEAQVYCSLPCRQAEENRRNAERVKERDARESEKDRALAFQESQRTPEMRDAVCAYVNCGRTFPSDNPRRFYCTMACATNAQKQRARQRANGAKQDSAAATPSPAYVVRLGKLSIECGTEEALDVVMRRYGGAPAQEDGFVVVGVRFTEVDHARMMVAANNDPSIDTPVSPVSIGDFVRACAMGHVEMIEDEIRATERASAQGERA